MAALNEAEFASQTLFRQASTKCDKPCNLYYRHEQMVDLDRSAIAVDAVDRAKQDQHPPGHRDNRGAGGHHRQNQRPALRGHQRLLDPECKRPATHQRCAALTLRQGPHPGQGDFSVSRYTGQGGDRYGRPDALAKATGAQRPGHVRALRQDPDRRTGEAAEVGALQGETGHFSACVFLLSAQNCRETPEIVEWPQHPKREQRRMNNGRA